MPMNSVARTLHKVRCSLMRVQAVVKVYATCMVVRFQGGPLG
jgi:hypothetical protein